MKKNVFSLYFVVMAFVCAPAVFAADAKDKTNEKSSDGKTAKSDPAAPVAFWAKDLPKVISKSEKRYDINRDEILQTSETKIFLRDVIAEVAAKSSFNVADSALLKAYDKNKDGIISNIEIDAIKKDLAY